MSKAKAKARKLKAKAKAQAELLRQQKARAVEDAKFSFTLKEALQLCFNNTNIRKVKYTENQLAPLRCHDNSSVVKDACEFFAETEGVDIECRHVEGWQIWEDKHMFTFNHHSVVEINGELVDTTPPVKGMKNLGFVEDLRNATFAYVYENILLMKRNQRVAKKNRLYSEMLGGKGNFWQISKDALRNNEFSPIKTGPRINEGKKVLHFHKEEAVKVIEEVISPFVECEQ